MTGTKRVTDPKGETMNALAVTLGILLSIGLVIGALALSALVIFWSIEDIQNVGVNFWNVFWLLCVAVFLLGVNRATD